MSASSSDSSSDNFYDCINEIYKNIVCFNASNVNEPGITQNKYLLILNDVLNDVLSDCANISDEKKYKIWIIMRSIDIYNITLDTFDVLIHNKILREMILEQLRRFISVKGGAFDYIINVNKIINLLKIFDSYEYDYEIFYPNMISCVLGYPTLHAIKWLIEKFSCDQIIAHLDSYFIYISDIDITDELYEAINLLNSYIKYQLTIDGILNIYSCLHRLINKNNLKLDGIIQFFIEVYIDEIKIACDKININQNPKYVYFQKLSNHNIPIENIFDILVSK